MDSVFCCSNNMRFSTSSALRCLFLVFCLFCLVRSLWNPSAWRAVLAHPEVWRALITTVTMGAEQVAAIKTSAAPVGVAVMSALWVFEGKREAAAGHDTQLDPVPCSVALYDPRHMAEGRVLPSLLQMQLAPRRAGRHFGTYVAAALWGLVGLAAGNPLVCRHLASLPKFTQQLHTLMTNPFKSIDLFVASAVLLSVVAADADAAAGADGSTGADAAACTASASSAASAATGGPRTMQMGIAVDMDAVGVGMAHLALNAPQVQVAALVLLRGLVWFNGPVARLQSDKGVLAQVTRLLDGEQRPPLRAGWNLRNLVLAGALDLVHSMAHAQGLELGLGIVKGQPGIGLVKQAIQLLAAPTDRVSSSAAATLWMLASASASGPVREAFIAARAVEGLYALALRQQAFGRPHLFQTLHTLHTLLLHDKDAAIRLTTVAEPQDLVPLADYTQPECALLIIRSVYRVMSCHAMPFGLQFVHRGGWEALGMLCAMGPLKCRTAAVILLGMALWSTLKLPAPDTSKEELVGTLVAHQVHEVLAALVAEEGDEYRVARVHAVKCLHTIRELAGPVPVDGDLCGVPGFEEGLGLMLSTLPADDKHRPLVVSLLSALCNLA